jgi:ankyrin repeat protein
LDNVLDKIDNFGVTPLLACCKPINSNVLFKKLNDWPTDKSNEQAKFKKYQCEKENLINFFIKNGANFHQVDKNGNSMFHYLAMQNEGDSICINLMKQINPSKEIINQRNIVNHTPLSYSIVNQNKPLFDIFFSLCTDHNISPIGFTVKIIKNIKKIKIQQKKQKFREELIYISP